MQKGETFEEDEGFFEGGEGHFQARRGFFEGWPSFRVRRRGVAPLQRGGQTQEEKKWQRKIRKNEGLGGF